ncbi:MAG: AAA family ATPase [Candidatus Caenarcaniphilales bacterium]|nr:AAA family ATPase [Candidatus Caenarcaniphilales bacterium]
MPKAPNSFKRLIHIDIPAGQSSFLWGIRKSGKSTFLKENYSRSLYIDLLKKDLHLKYLQKPYLLREEVLALSEDELAYPIIIDEVQKIPNLLDEIHWLIENTEAYFILCGSSARKLRRGAANLLGGRAWSFHMHPLTYKEISELEEFDLLKALNNGLIPSHYNSKQANRSLKAYVSEYLNEEIKAESLVRNLSNFARFLDIFAFSHGEITNYTNLSRDCGVDAKTIKEYYQILIDTLMGHYLYPFSGMESRDTIRATPKFYLADTGLATFLCQKSINILKGAEAGKAFEHFIFMELIAYKDLEEKNISLNFWRNKNKLEVDFIVNRGAIAIEVKISNSVEKRDLKGLIEFQRRFPATRAIVVSLDSQKRKIILEDNKEIMIYPYQEFLEALWKGEFF